MKANNPNWRANIRETETHPIITHVSINDLGDVALIETYNVSLMEAMGDLDSDDFRLRSLGIESDDTIETQLEDEYDGGEVVRVVGDVPLVELPALLSNIIQEQNHES